MAESWVCPLQCKCFFPVQARVKPIIINTYGGTPLTVSKRISLCWNTTHHRYTHRIIVANQLATLCGIENTLKKHIHLPIALIITSQNTPQLSDSLSLLRRSLFGCAPLSKHISQNCCKFIRLIVFHFRINIHGDLTALMSC